MERVARHAPFGYIGFIL